MDNLVVRKPTGADLTASLHDMVTLRAAPPLVIAAAAMVILTGNILVSLLSVGVTSFVHAFWSRLIGTDSKQ